MKGRRGLVHRFRVIGDDFAVVEAGLCPRADEPSAGAQLVRDVTSEGRRTNLMRLSSLVGYTTPTAPPAYSQPVQGYGTAAYDTSTATVTTTQASYAAPSAYGTQPAYPAYGQPPAASAPAR